MSNETKKTALPKLRFPEFEEAPEWVERKLGDIMVEARLGSNFQSSLAGTGIPAIKMANLNRGRINIDKIECLEIGSSYNESDLLKVGDLLFNTRNTLELVGKVAIWNNELPVAVYNTNILRLVFDDKTVSSNHFMNYLFNTKGILEKLRSIATGTTSVAAIYSKDLNKLKIIIPSPAEQKKIAATLSSLDDLITAQSAKLTAIQAHKRGLMQGLFPAEGETVPKLRFPEFEEAEEWEKKTLGDVCKMQAGKFVAASSIHANNQDDFFPCYGGNGLRGYTKTFTHEGKYSLVGRQGALCGNVMLATGKFHATEHAVVTTPKAAVDTDWLYYLLVILDLNQYAAGAAQPGLSVQNLEKLEIRIPNTEAEQQKIADCLSSLDDRITAQAQKIEALKLHKKGLMQNLFPAAAEPTA